MNADLRVGTCGYSFPDWRGTIYPPNLRPSLYLVYYARTLGFNAVELDSSFYHMPTIPLVQALIQKTPPGFLFTIKAHRSMTHEVWNAMKPTAPGGPPFPDLKQGLKTTSQLAPAFMAFREAVAPMADAGKLGTVVLQYPPWFRDTPENRRFLLTTRDLLAGLPLSIEFRDLTWHNDDAFAFLRQEHLGYVAVDEPQLHNSCPWFQPLPATWPISGCTDAIHTGSVPAVRNGMTIFTQRMNWNRCCHLFTPWLQARH